MCASSLAQAQSPQSSGNYIVSLIQSALDEHGYPELAVSFYKNGEITSLGFERIADTYQQQDAEKTLFEIGSLTKTLTALLLAQAVINYQANLNDTVGQYLNTLAKYPVGAVTLRQLVTHTSGLPTSPKTSPPMKLAVNIFHLDQRFHQSYCKSRSSKVT